MENPPASFLLTELHRIQEDLLKANASYHSRSPLYQIQATNSHGVVLNHVQFSLDSHTKAVTVLAQQSSTVGADIQEAWNKFMVRFGNIDKCADCGDTFDNGGRQVTSCTGCVLRSGLTVALPCLMCQVTTSNIYTLRCGHSACRSCLIKCKESLCRECGKEYTINVGFMERRKECGCPDCGADHHQEMSDDEDD
jgi:hypothetical protein